MIVLSIFMVNFVFACDQHVAFSPKERVDIEAWTKDQRLFVEIRSSGNIKIYDFEFDTEKKINLTINDFNFDGYTDISVRHIDDGMGIFTISRVFIFSPVSDSFYEIFPSCGEQFLNLKIDAGDKKLLSSYFKNNVPVVCETYSKN